MKLDIKVGFYSHFTGKMKFSKTGVEILLFKFKIYLAISILNMKIAEIRSISMSE